MAKGIFQVAEFLPLEGVLKLENGIATIENAEVIFAIKDRLFILQDDLSILMFRLALWSLLRLQFLVISLGCLEWMCWAVLLLLKLID